VITSPTPETVLRAVGSGRSAVLPSGEQIEIEHGPLRAVITEVGGAIRTLSDGDVPVLEGYRAGEMCGGGRGQPLLPWPNRLAGGRYEFGGRRHQTPLTEPSQDNAIHGLTRWANWSVALHEANRTIMSYLLHPQPGYPFALALAIEYSLSENGLTVSTTARNAGTEALPYAEGFHPYITVGTATIDSNVLTLPESSALVVDDHQIPTGERMPMEGNGFDFRSPRPIGNTRLDTAFGDVKRDRDGRARVRLESDDGSRAVTVWLDQAHPYYMIFTGDSLDDPTRRRTGLGVEPMTCAPNAFVTGDGLRVLEPEESWTTVWGIAAGLPR
jgi:aldose 1-epimerase